MRFRKAVRDAIRAAEIAIPVAVTRRNERADEKGDVSVGHHAIVTRTDTVTQDAILRSLAQSNPHARFLTEEKAKGHAGVVAQPDSQILCYPLVNIVDPLDGSSFRNRGLPEWSISIGPIECGSHIGGVITAPEILGGFTVLGERGKAVMASERGGKFRRVGTITNRPHKKSNVFMGLDVSFLPQFARFVPAVAKEVQTVGSTTCALGLAYLATGKADALVQPVHSPWDWAAGYPLVEEAGGKFQFYHYRDGRVVAMNVPDVLSYDPVRRNTAFIAGAPALVDWLFAVLKESWVAPA